jgi:hypothetical protein
MPKERGWASQFSINKARTIPAPSNPRNDQDNEDAHDGCGGCSRNPSPPSGWIEDFDPQAVGHARHKITKAWALLVVMVGRMGGYRLLEDRLRILKRELTY